MRGMRDTGSIETPRRRLLTFYTGTRILMVRYGVDTLGAASMTDHIFIDRLTVGRRSFGAAPPAPMGCQR